MQTKEIKQSVWPGTAMGTQAKVWPRRLSRLSQLLLSHMTPYSGCSATAKDLQPFLPSGDCKFLRATEYAFRTI